MRSALTAYGLRLTAAIVSFTASADFLSAACSSGDSFTSRIFSSPLRPSLQGTPQYMPDRPYSPCSQAQRRVPPRAQPPSLPDPPLGGDPAHVLHHPAHSLERVQDNRDEGLGSVLFDRRGDMPDFPGVVADQAVRSQEHTPESSHDQ